MVTRQQKEKLSPAVSSPSNLPIPPSLVETLKKLDPRVLEALVFGYLAGRSASDLPCSAGPALDAQPEEPELFDLQLASSNVLDEALLSDAAGLEATFLSATLAEDVMTEVLKRIFSVSRSKGYVVTTTTVPSDLMAQGNWITLGRAIFASIVKKYPKFTPYADPGRLPRFYGHPLSVFATAIRTAIG